MSLYVSPPASPNPHLNLKTVFYSDGIECKIQRLFELLIFVADKYLDPRELNALRCITSIHFDAKRALRIERLDVNQSTLFFVNTFANNWLCRSAKLSDTLKKEAPLKPIFSACATVNATIFWRSRKVKRCQKQFQIVIVCRDVAFNTPLQIGMISQHTIYAKADKKNLGKYIYLKYLGGNPDNISSSNRVEGGVRAIISYLNGLCKEGQFKGIYLESLKPAEAVFKTLGFVNLNKEEILCRGYNTQPMHRLVTEKVY